MMAPEWGRREVEQRNFQNIEKLSIVGKGDALLEKKGGRRRESIRGGRSVRPTSKERERNVTINLEKLGTTGERR
jgi:hypothetical protein